MAFRSFVYLLVVGKRKAVRTEEVAQLRELFTRRGPDDVVRDRAWTDLRERPFTSTRALADYHDLMLFILAFPWSMADHAIANSELARVADLVASMVSKSEASRYAFMNSGIAGAPSRASFSLDLVRWLAARRDAGARLEDLEGEEGPSRMVWASACGPVEREAAEDERRTLMEAILDACGHDPVRALRELVSAVDRSAGFPGTRSALWEVMKPVMAFVPGRSPITRTWARGIVRGLTLRRIEQPISWDVRTLQHERLRPLEKLTAAERTKVLEAARGVLVGHLRETDTAVLCDKSGLDVQPMGDGLHIALLTLPPGRRMPFDAYVGYVAFVNGMPAAYGGAWIFPGRSKIGINIFPAFRGGPSAWLFARIIQCYAKRFGVGRFEAEGYQLGHGNPEGIRSGAYWFYDRLGFRTTDEELALVADHEREVRKHDRTHRTSPEVLRKLASRPMWLDLSPEPAPVFDLVELGEAVMRAHVPTAGVDRSRIIARTVQEVSRSLDVGDRSSWPVAERKAFEDLAPAIARIEDLAMWPVNDKRKLVLLMRAKALRTEDRYIALLRTHRRLLSAWEDLASAAEVAQRSVTASGSVRSRFRE